MLPAAVAFVAGALVLLLICAVLVVFGGPLFELIDGEFMQIGP